MSSYGRRRTFKRSSSRSRPYAKRRFTRYPKTVSRRSRAPLASRGFRFPMTGELKAIDVPLFAGIDAVGVAVLLNGCIQGTDIANRIGRKICVKSLTYRFTLKCAAADLVAAPGVTFYAPGQMIRMIILWDMQPNGAAPAIGDVLTNAADNTSQLNLNNRDRFRIVKDKMFCFDPFWHVVVADDFVGFNHTTTAHKGYKKMNQEVIFNAGNAGGVGDIASGSLYVMFIGDAAAAANMNINLVGNTRVRFTDP